MGKPIRRYTENRVGRVGGFFVRVVPILTLLLAVGGTTQAMAADKEVKTANDRALRYDWQVGKSYPYRVKVEVDLGDEMLELTGAPVYHVVSSEGDKVKLGFRGFLTERVRSKSGGPSVPRMGPRGMTGPRGMMGPRGPHGPGGPRMRSMFSPLTGMGPGGAMMGGTELTIDRQGNIAHQRGTSHLPLLLGNLSHLMIEVLPAEPKSSWTVENDSGIVIREGMPRFGPFAETESFVPATEKTTYTVESKNDKETVIRKQYEFVAVAAAGEKPPFEISGDGKYTFNNEEGVSGKLDFSMTLTVRKDGGLAVQIPVKVNYTFLDEAEIARAAEEREALIEKREANREKREAAREKLDAQLKELDAGRERLDRRFGERAGPSSRTPSMHAPVNEKEIDGIVADLESGQLNRTLPALMRLSRNKPETPNRKVAEALEKILLEGSSASSRTNAAKALANWGTNESLPALKKAAQDSSRLLKSNAQKAIAEIVGRE